VKEGILIGKSDDHQALSRFLLMRELELFKAEGRRKVLSRDFFLGGE